VLPYEPPISASRRSGNPLVCRVRPHPQAGNHLAADQQVGESGCPRLDARRIWQGRETKSTEATCNYYGLRHANRRPMGILLSQIIPQKRRIPIFASLHVGRVTCSILESSSLASDPRTTSTPDCLMSWTAVAKSDWRQLTISETNRSPTPLRRPTMPTG